MIFEKHKYCFEVASAAMFLEIHAVLLSNLALMCSYLPIFLFFEIYISPH